MILVHRGIALGIISARGGDAGAASAAEVAARERSGDRAASAGALEERLLHEAEPLGACRSGRTSKVTARRWHHQVDVADPWSPRSRGRERRPAPPLWGRRRGGRFEGPVRRRRRAGIDRWRWNGTGQAGARLGGLETGHDRKAAARRAGQGLRRTSLAVGQSRSAVRRPRPRRHAAPNRCPPQRRDRNPPANPRLPRVPRALFPGGGEGDEGSVVGPQRGRSGRGRLGDSRTAAGLSEVSNEEHRHGRAATIRAACGPRQPRACA